MPPDDPASGGSTRRTPTVLLVLALVLLVARVAIGVLEQRHPPRVSDLVRWRPIAGAEREALQSGKPVLYEFTAEWCEPCQVMQRELFADPATADGIERMFVPVRVLDRQREEGRNTAEVDALQRRFSVSAFPTLVVVSPAGGDPVSLAGYEGKEPTLRSLAAARAQTMPPMRVQYPVPGASPR